MNDDIAVRTGGCAVEVRPAQSRAKPMTRPRGVIFLLTGLGGFLVSLDVSIANGLLSPIGADFDTADRAKLSWILTAYAIVFAAVLVPAGRVADRVGRRRTYVGGLLVFAAGSALCGLAPNLAVLVGGRLVQGVGAAAAAPASIGLLLAASSSAHRSLYTARWTGAAALGVCLGPLAGGALTTLASWRLAFLINIPIVAAVVAAARRVLPETPRQPGRSLPDPVGALLLALSAATLTLAISEAPTWGFMAARTILTVAGGGVLVGFFIHRSRRVADPVFDLRLLGQRRIAVATITTMLYSAGFFGLLLTFVQFLIGPWHLSVVMAGMALLPIGLVVVAMTTHVGHLATSVGFRIPLIAGSEIMAVGLVLSAASRRRQPSVDYLASPRRTDRRRNRALLPTSGCSSSGRSRTLSARRCCCSEPMRPTTRIGIRDSRRRRSARTRRRAVHEPIPRRLAGVRRIQCAGRCRLELVAPRQQITTPTTDAPRRAHLRGAAWDGPCPAPIAMV